MTVQSILKSPEPVTELICEVTHNEILPRFQKLAEHEIQQKLSGEMVTAADHAAEAALAAGLQQMITGSMVIGEEGAAADPTVMDRLEGEAPVWVIDPLDGTRNFASGNRCFAVIVALCLKGQTLAGWIHNPLSDATAIAIHGEGAWVGETRLCVAPTRSIPNMSGSLGPRRRKLIAERAADGVEVPQKAFRYGCAGMEYFHLSDGTIDFAEYVSLKPWDHAAGVLIHREAGGFSADTETGEAYVPRKQYMGRLLMAPDAMTWHQLRELFAQG